MRKDRGRVIFLAASALLIGLGLWAFQREGGQDPDLLIESGPSASAVSEEALGRSSLESRPKEKQRIAVDIAGQVRSPGLYFLEEGDRINDLVTAAGGFTAEADRREINLAMRLADEMKVYVPSKKEAAASTPSASNVAAGGSGLVSLGKKQGTEKTGGQKKVDLNRASREELMTIPFVGEKKADDIIAYRSKKPFQTKEDIKKISGIGEKTFNRMKDYITVEE